MKIAFVFPGQGSQRVGMLSELAQHHDVVQETFAQASQLLGYDLWDLVQKGPAEKLDQTEFTQPALLVADVATYRCWSTDGGEQPELLAGHSLGEYAALVVAGVLAFEDAVQLAANRGRYMQAAVPAGTGAMAAVLGLDDDKVDELCREVAEGDVLSPANYNSIGQVVIAGERNAVERAVAQAKDKGAKLAKLIPVSVPSHCELMRPAAERLQKDLESVNLNSPNIPVLHNVDAKTHDAPDEIRAALVQQLYSPVRWVDTIRTMHVQGIEQLIECGPGKVLAGLNKRIVRELVTDSIAETA